MHCALECQWIIVALMGPTLMCDKSSLQSLNPQELNALRRYYALNVPPILVTEILADLKKEGESDLARQKVEVDPIVWTKKRRI